MTIADKDGQLVPRAKNLVKFTLAGPTEIAGVDNGDATSFELLNGTRLYRATLPKSSPSHFAAAA